MSGLTLWREEMGGTFSECPEDVYGTCQEKAYAGANSEEIV
jgi:hypothetical protein